jgi:hypothetical protein
VETKELKALRALDLAITVAAAAGLSKRVLAHGLWKNSPIEPGCESRNLITCQTIPVTDVVYVVVQNLF